MHCSHYFHFWDGNGQVPSFHCSQIPSRVAQKNDSEFHTPSASLSCALGWSCHIPWGAIPRQAPCRLGEQHSQAQPSTSVSQEGIPELIQTDFQHCQAWAAHGHGESGISLELCFSLPSFPVNSPSQRISLGPLALLLLWLKKRAFSTHSLSQPAGAVTNRGARLRGKSLSDQRDPANFQINQQKPQTMIHPATNFGGEWEKIIQGRAKSSDFIDISSSIEAVRKALVATCSACSRGHVNLSRILDHLSGGKRPVHKSCASGRCGRSKPEQYKTPWYHLMLPGPLLLKAKVT